MFKIKQCQSAETSNIQTYKLIERKTNMFECLIIKAFETNPKIHIKDTVSARIR